MDIANATAKQKLMGSGLLTLIGFFALFMAFVVVPAISESSGIADEYVSFALAGVAFVVAIVAMRWAKSLNKK